MKSVGTFDSLSWRKDNDKLIKKKEDFYISLLNYKNEYRFIEKGDEDLSGNKGDIRILVNIVKQNQLGIFQDIITLIVIEQLRVNTHRLLKEW